MRQVDIVSRMSGINVVISRGDRNHIIEDISVVNRDRPGYKKNPCQGKHREVGNIAKTQGIWFSHFVNSLILKVRDILIFPAKICLVSLNKFCICNSHKSHKLPQGKFAVGQGKHREFEKCNLSGYPDRHNNPTHSDSQVKVIYYQRIRVRCQCHSHHRCNV